MNTIAMNDGGTMNDDGTTDVAITDEAGTAGACQVYPKYPNKKRPKKYPNKKRPKKGIAYERRLEEICAEIRAEERAATASAPVEFSTVFRKEDLRAALRYLSDSPAATAAAIGSSLMLLLAAALEDDKWEKNPPLKVITITFKPH